MFTRLEDGADLSGMHSRTALKITTTTTTVKASNVIFNCKKLINLFWKSYVFSTRSACNGEVFINCTFLKHWFRERHTKYEIF